MVAPPDSDDAGPGNAGQARASGAWRPNVPKAAAPLLAWALAVPLSAALFIAAVALLALR